MNSIRTKDLTKIYDTKAGSLIILDQLNLNIEPGSIVAIEGASGSGKSTLLNILGTIDVPTSGDVYYDSQELNKISNRNKERLRAQKIGFIFQNYYLLPDFTVLENVMLPLLISRYSWLQARKESMRLLEMVGLESREAHYPSQISGGEMARTGVARALVGNKRLILADEPTGNLDQNNSDRITNLLLSLQKELSFSLILVTHDRDLAMRVPVCYRLHQGKLSLVS